MPNEMFEGAQIKYGEKEKQQAIEALKRQFKDFSKSAQLAVLELLEKMIVFGDFGEDALDNALDTMGDELFEAEEWGANRDNRGENLALLGRQENGLVGKVFMVYEIKDILEKIK